MKKLLLALAIAFMPFQTLAGSQVINVKVHGLVCDFCAQAIGMMMKRDPSIQASHINLSSKIVTVQLRNGRQISDQRIRQLITAAGYQVVGIAR